MKEIQNNNLLSYILLVGGCVFVLLNKYVAWIMVRSNAYSARLFRMNKPPYSDSAVFQRLASIFIGLMLIWFGYVRLTHSR